MTQGGTPPGWYPDAHGYQRWWDGSRWADPPQQQEFLQAGPPGPPGPPPPPGPPGHQPKKSRVGLVVGLVAAVLLLAGGVVALVLVLGGDDDGDSAGGDPGDDPAATVEAFLDAAREGDCAAAEELVTDDFWANLGEPEGCPDDLAEDDEELEFEVGEAEIDGDEATVPVTSSVVGEDSADSGSTIDLLLVREDGEWLIDDIDIDLPPAPEPPDPGTPEPPSDFPSIDPSDLPTDFPSIDPSDLPTDFPSIDPSDLPTDFPTDFPTEGPS